LNQDCIRCVVCLERPKVCTLVHGDTGHLCCCEECAELIRRRRDHCPMCRRAVAHVIRQY
jgi:E3 ubiquitin-protein ligase Mdm2